ncbi:4-hydroxyphenylpyruvate dioxygenase [Myxosarcina sp. GI1]|uniref:4-hydroxyphenylpyruvate dioxygenase n=1 Tax=Myxosarcina sp. GI1 TaxID=1541065 RepID=UPI00055D1AC5|nr:4-hydroxyphenylpyruvate dioxygenase [Myxosarcina sp. GI1]
MEIAYVHFYTRNAAETSNWFIRNLDFQAIAKSLDNYTQTEVIAGNSVFLLISSPLNSRSPVFRYLQKHPSGVADIAFKVNSLKAVIDKARDLGVKILRFPQIQKTERGNVKVAKIVGWDSLEHTLIETSGDEPISFLPIGKERQTEIACNSSSGIIDIDHIVLNVAAGQLKAATAWYQSLFGLQVRQSFKIKTDRSGLYSEALADASGKVQFNLNEPTSASSQIQEFLDFNGGSGIQHLALRCDNLIDAVNYMRSREVAFLAIPKAYYRQIEQKSGDRLSLSAREWQAIEQTEILIDWQREHPRSLLMQTFTKPIFERPTFFLEFIERRQQATGFGEGNFQALFEAVEREQSNR